MRGVVVLGDVVGSRDLDDREAFAARVRDVIERVNETFADALAASFTMLKGIDEFVGVLDSVVPLYDVLDTLETGIAPAETRVVAVAGEIDVAGDDATQLDGPAFHEADRLLGRLESRTLFVDVQLGDERLDGLITATANALYLLKRRWTDRQRTIVSLYREMETQAAVAERLGVRQQTVSDVLAAAEWPRIRRLEAELHETLAAYPGEVAAP